MRHQSKNHRNINKSTKHEWVVAGTHAIKECLMVNPGHISDVWVTKNCPSDVQSVLKKALQKKSFTISEKPKEVLDKEYSGHQHALLFLEQRPEFDRSSIKDQSLILFLDGVEDPQNLGAILRSGWLMGVSAIHLPTNRSVSLTPTVFKVASGGAEHVPIVYETNFQNSLQWYKDNGFWVFGLSHLGEKSIQQVELPRKSILILGAEDKGLRSTTSDLCDELIRVPQVSSNASYNVSVAGALAMYEWVRQVKY